MFWNSISRVHSKIQKNSLAVLSPAKELLCDGGLKCRGICYARVDYNKLCKSWDIMLQMHQVTEEYFDLMTVLLVIY